MKMTPEFHTAINDMSTTYLNEIGRHLVAYVNDAGDVLDVRIELLTTAPFRADAVLSTADPRLVPYV